jgi:transcription termination factor NusB
VLAVSAARDALARHHGGGMGSQAKSDDWLCKACKGADGQPFKNFGHRSACFRCAQSKAKCSAGKAPAQTLAERQVAAQRRAPAGDAKAKFGESPWHTQGRGRHGAAHSSGAAAETADSAGDATDSEQPLIDLIDLHAALKKVYGAEDARTLEALRAVDERRAKRRAALPLATRIFDADKLVEARRRAVAAAATEQGAAVSAVEAAAVRLERASAAGLAADAALAAAQEARATLCIQGAELQSGQAPQTKTQLLAHAFQSMEQMAGQTADGKLAFAALQALFAQAIVDEQAAAAVTAMASDATRVEAVTVQAAGNEVVDTADDQAMDDIEFNDFAAEVRLQQKEADEQTEPTAKQTSVERAARSARALASLAAARGKVQKGSLKGKA